jgi:uncharacterized membrane protein YhiD involved in acid resistance
MEAFFDSFAFSAFIRLLISAVLGGALGFERMKKLRPPDSEPILSLP